MSPQLEWRMWRQLRGAFGVQKFIFTPIVPEMLTVNVGQFQTMEEALDHCSGKLLFLEPTGEKTVASIERSDEDITFVLGNTEHNNLEFSDRGEIIRINSRGTDLYGINAAAIALAYWYGQ